MARSYNFFRKELRFNHEGKVFLYTSNGEVLQARGRDLSSVGIGIKFLSKLKGFRLGAEVEIEFAVPNHLRGLKIKAQLRRVNADSKGHHHCGFAIIDNDPMVKQRINEIITFYNKSPRRFLQK